MRSIRGELTCRLLTGTSALVLLTVALFSIAIHSRVVGEFDHTLETKARALATLTSREGQAIDVDFADEYMPEFTRENKPEYFVIAIQDGTIVEKSDSLGNGSLPFVLPLSETPVFGNLELPDGRPGRFIQLAVPPRLEEAEAEETEDGLFMLPAAMETEAVFLVLTVAGGREELNGLLLFLYLALGGLGGLLLAGSAILIHLTIRKGFEPIDSINDQITAAGPDALDLRVHLPATPKELATILAALNGLLERVALAFARERRFSSDLAHELRTPVAELRTACEVGGKWPEDSESVRGYFADIRDISLQMERTVTSLLALTRCDNGTATVVEETVLLAPIVQQCWDRTAENAATETPPLRSEVGPHLAVRTDRDKLEMIVQNLMDNAATYSVPGQSVTCAAHKDASGVRLIIGNRPADLAREDLDHLFDRFWRKDPARSGGSHWGIGLSIVQALTGILGIGIDVTLTAGGDFHVQLSFPPASES